MSPKFKRWNAENKWYTGPGMQCSLTLITQNHQTLALTAGRTTPMNSQLYGSELLGSPLGTRAMLPSVATHNRRVPIIYSLNICFYFIFFRLDLLVRGWIGVASPISYCIGKVLGSEVRLVIVFSLDLDEAAVERGLHPAQTPPRVLVPTGPVQFVPVLIVHPEFITFEY